MADAKPPPMTSVGPDTHVSIEYTTIPIIPDCIVPKGQSRRIIGIVVGSTRDNVPGTEMVENEFRCNLPKPGIVGAGTHPECCNAAPAHYIKASWPGGRRYFGRCDKHRMTPGSFSSGVLYSIISAEDAAIILVHES